MSGADGTAWLDHWLIEAAERHASDIHLVAGQPPRLRIDGALAAIDAEPVTAEAITAALDLLLDDEERARFDADGDLDHAVERRAPNGSHLRYRLHAFRSHGRAAIALRVIHAEIPNLAELGAPAALSSMTEAGSGLVLVTGPTGSGKSTTLAAMIEQINRRRRCHILTLEDPVEFVFRPDQALISQREIGRDVPSFEAGLRAALRSDPDVILVGEMRDLETIRLALRAAETGHLVLSTLHTISAPKTVDRILDVFPTGDKEIVRTQLAGALRGVISQRLLPKVGGGRVAAFEVLVATDAIRNLIREQQIHQIASMLQLGQRHGMTHLPEEIGRLVQSGLVDPGDAAHALSTISDEIADQPTEQTRATAFGDF